MKKEWILHYGVLISAHGLYVNAESNSDECGIFFAPSSIPGAGYGMFAGKDFKKGSIVTPGDLVVAYADMGWHNGVAMDDDLYLLWNAYSWGDGFMGFGSEGLVTYGASFGIGAVPNCFFPFVNLRDSWNMVDQAGLHRSKDPGAGAFTSYYNRQGIADVDIPAGMELFISYGENYFRNRDGFQTMPHPEDYHVADDIMEDLAYLRENSLNIPGTESSIFSDLYNLIHSFNDVWSSPVLSALPDDVSHVSEIVELGTDQVHYNRTIYTLDYLQRYGSCMDNIKPSKSTVHQAGRGAFATRKIGEGTTIAPVPLIHIPHRNMFDMYKTIQGTHRSFYLDERDGKADPYHRQLLLNYCFGHTDIEILLCPYGVGTSLVNHWKKNANAKIVWGHHMANPEWLEKHPSEWSDARRPGLSFDLVATRDIDMDEEIFIDYGDEWEDAWNTHVDNFSPIMDGYVPDYELNEVVDLVIPTHREWTKSSSIQELYCHNDAALMGRRVDLYDIEANPYLPCRVLERYEDTNGNTYYDVEILRREGDALSCIEKVSEFLIGVPRSIFLFIDQHKTRDSDQPWSFRHDMRIPDAIVPAVWKGKPGNITGGLFTSKYLNESHNY